MGTRRRRGRPPRQRLPAPARAEAARAGLPRGHQGHRPRPTTSATGCAASVAAASSRSPCGPACRSSRSPWSAPRSRCRSSSRSTRWPRRSALPVLPGHRQHARFGPLGASCYFPAKFKLRVLEPVTFDVEPDQPRYSRSRDHGRVRGHPPAHPGGALRHAPPTRARSGSADDGDPPRQASGARHRAVHVLGRPGGPGPRGRPRRRRHHRPRHATSRRCGSSAPSTSAPTRTTRS